jgi:DNA-binding transcriptional ArsR family regulator
MSDVIDYELDGEIDGRSVERMKAIADPLRLLVLDLVLERAMTVTELAERVQRPRGTVAHHVDVLVDAGLLKVVRTRKVRALEERFYGRVARTVILGSHGDPGVRRLPFVDDAAAEADYERMATDECGSGFTLRHARIPAARASEYVARLYALAVEFSAEPRDGDVEHALLVGVFPTTRPVAPARARRRAR